MGIEQASACMQSAGSPLSAISIQFLFREGVGHVATNDHLILAPLTPYILHTAQIRGTPYRRHIITGVQKPRQKTSQ